MDFASAVRSVFRNYATFSGRARRAEYWWFFLFNIIAVSILGVLDGMIFGYEVTSSTLAEGDGFTYAIETPGYLLSIWSLLTFLPSLAVTVRRLHDTNRSGWWFLILFLPLIGLVLMIVWLIRGGDQGANSYGPDPISGRGDSAGPSSIPRVPRH